MNELKRYIVQIELIVLGESPYDAAMYAQDAIARCDILSQDGIIGVPDEIDSKDVTEYSAY
jgi:hypothetical protein